MEDRTRQLEQMDARLRADHDTLVRVEQALKGVAEDVRELKDGFVHQLAEQKLIIEDNRLRVAAVESKVNEVGTTIRVLKWALGFVVATTAFVLSTASGVRDLFNR